MIEWSTTDGLALLAAIVLAICAVAALAYDAGRERGERDERRRAWARTAGRWSKDQ